MIRIRTYNARLTQVFDLTLDKPAGVWHGFARLMSPRRSGSLASLREGNRKRVVDALRERGLASRAELARATDLSRSTISTIVGDLIDSGLAVERDGPPLGEAHAGRPG